MWVQDSPGGTSLLLYLLLRRARFEEQPQGWLGSQGLPGHSEAGRPNRKQSPRDHGTRRALSLALTPAVNMKTGVPLECMPRWGETDNKQMSHVT